MSVAHDTTMIIHSVDKDGNVTGRSVAHIVPKRTAVEPTQWAAGDSAVSLGWGIPAGGGPVRWKVQRDHTLLAHTGRTSFTDQTGDRSTPHTYTISGTQDVKTDRGTQERPIRYQIAVPATDMTAIGKAWSTELLRSPEANQDIMPIERRNGASYRATIDWNAFIHEQYIEAPWICPETLEGVAYYQGDDRDFVTDTVVGLVRSRIASESSTLFSNGYNVIDGGIFTPFVGRTVAYDENFNVLAEGQESDEDIYLDHREDTDAFGEKYIQMSGSDPLCLAGLAPPIDVTYYNRVTIDGDIRITGEHDKAPDHEAVYHADHYFADSWQESGCVYRFANKGFNNLANPLQAVMDVSFNPELGAFPDCAVQ